jgi:hypothetical protein
MNPDLASTKTSLNQDELVAVEMNEAVSLTLNESLRSCRDGTQAPDWRPIHTRPPDREKKSAFIGVHPHL